MSETASPSIPLRDTARVLGIGVAGVDVFFVISGFVMAKVAIDEPVARFLRKRFVRIVPLYRAVTLGFCALGLTTHLSRHFAVPPADLVRSLLCIPYVNAQGRVWPIVIPGWTLDFEMAFYGVFAIETCHGWPRIGALRWLGDISYSLYLTHGFVFLVTGRLTAHWVGATILAPLVAICTATAVAGAIHHGFERPLMRWVR